MVRWSGKLFGGLIGCELGQSIWQQVGAKAIGFLHRAVVDQSMLKQLIFGVKQTKENNYFSRPIATLHKKFTVNDALQFVFVCVAVLIYSPKDKRSNTRGYRTARLLHPIGYRPCRHRRIRCLIVFLLVCQTHI